MRKDMGFIKKEVPPPDVKEGEILSADIVDVQWPVKGEYGEQVKFTLKLDSGYQLTVWQKFYDTPSERSVLGIVLTTLMGLERREYQDVNQALTALKSYGRVYVKCSGFREWQEKLYPKFKLVANKLPPKQTEITVEPQSTETQKLTIDEVRERTKGWPKEDVDAYVDHLRNSGKLAEGF